MPLKPASLRWKHDAVVYNVTTCINDNGNEDKGRQCSVKARASTKRPETYPSKVKESAASQIMAAKN